MRELKLKLLEKVMVQICYVVTLISACFGALTLIFGFGSARSAPQEAAAAALAIALAVIPYVFSRCVQISSDRKSSKRRHEELLEVMRSKSNSIPASTDPLAPMVARTDWQ